MKDTQKLWLLLGTSCFLILTLILGLIFSAPSRTKRDFKEPLLVSLLPQRVNQIEVFDGESLVKLSRPEGKWMVAYGENSVSADEKKVEDFLEILSQLPRGKKITSNEEKYEQFGVHSQSSTSFIKLTMDNGGEALAYFGNPVADSGGFRYVRAEGEKAVYESTDPGVAIYGRRSHWVDLNLFSTSQKEKEVISLKLKGNSPVEDNEILTYTLIKTVKDSSSTELVWKGEGSHLNLDSPRVDSLIHRILELKAVDLIVPKRGLNEETGIFTLQLAFKDGEEITLLLGEISEEEDRFSATILGQDKEWALSRYALENILKPLEYYKK